MAGRNIKGITIEIGGETTKLQNALKGVDKEIKSTNQQLKDVNKLLKLDPTNVDLLKQKQKLLNDAINETEDKLKTLKTAADQANEELAQGKISQEQYDALQREIIETEENLKKLKKEAKQTNPELQALGGKMKDVGGKMTDAGKDMMVVTAAVVGVGAAAISAAKELDEGYDTIIKKTGATGEAFESLKKSADNVFGSMPVDMDVVGSAIGEVNTRFGATGEELENLTRSFIQFAEINGTDVAQSVESVDKIMERFNLDASQTPSVLGLLTSASQTSGIGIDTLTSSLTTNGATLRELGFGITESVNFLAQLEASGVDTGTALAGLKKEITNAAKDGKDANEVLKETIEGIKNAETETEALQKAQEVFGTKGAVEFTDAIRNGKLNVDDLSGAIESYGTTVEDTYNATLDPWDKMKEQTNGLKLAGDSLAGAIFETLGPALEKLGEVVGKVAEWFKQLPEGGQKIIVVLGLLVAAIGPLLLIVGGLITFVGNIITMAPAVGAALSTAMGPIGIAIAVIAALIAAGVLLASHWDEIKAKATEVWEAVKETVSTAVDNVKSFFQGIIDFVSNNWQALLTLLVNPFTGAFMLLYDNCDAFREFIDKTFEKIKNFITDKLDTAKTNAINAVETLKTNITDKINTAKQNAIDAFEALKNGITDKIEAAKRAVSDVMDGIKQAIKDKIDDAKNWGRDLVQGIINGIKSMISNVASAASSVASTISSYLHFSRPDVGPLHDYETWMPDFVKGLAQSLNRSKHILTDEVAKMSSDMVVNYNNKKVETMLGQYLPYLSKNQAIYLDTGALVGATAPAMNKQFYKISMMER